jgi:mucin-6/19
MRIVEITAGTAMVLCLTLAPIDAASKGKGSAPTRVSSSPAPTATASPKTSKTTAKATKTPKVTTTSGAPTTTTTAQTKPGKAETKSAKKSGTTSTTTSLTTTTAAGTTTTEPTTTTKIDFTQGKVADLLTKNTKLAEKLANQLKAMGYAGDVYEAAYGFKSLGGFVSTVNNAQNQNLSFEQLKALRTGMSVDADGVVLYANRNPDGTVTMVPLEKVTNPAPTQSLGQAKKTLQTSNTTTTTVTN